MTRRTGSLVVLLGLLVHPCLAAQAARKSGAAAPAAEGRRPVRNLRILPRPKSGLMQVILVNAQSSNPDQPCRKSVAVAVDPEAPGDISVTGLIKVRDHVEEGCWCDDPGAGLAVLAPGRAVAYFGRDILCAPRPEGTLNVELRPRREIRVEVWPRDAKLASLARDELANADWILDKNLTGLALRPHFNKADKEVSKTTCANAARGGRYVPGVINLYYGVGAGNSAGSNLSCGNGPFVLVSDVPSFGDAAHEISHKLGLNIRDHHLDYPEGHTTGKRGFSCANTMWTRSDTLNHLYTPGQAFWMSLSCTSFAAFQGPCLACTTRDGAASPCPPFVLGQVEEDRECPRCTVTEARSIARRVSARTGTPMSDAPAVSPNVQQRPQFCEQSTLESKLRERHAILAQRAAAGELKLGLTKVEDFVLEWSARIGVSVIIENISEGGSDRDEGIRFLEEEFKKGPLKNESYLIYSIEKIRKGRFTKRCNQDDPPPEEPQPSPQ